VPRKSWDVNQRRSPSLGPRVREAWPQSRRAGLRSESRPRSRSKEFDHLVGRAGHVQSSHVVSRRTVPGEFGRGPTARAHEDHVCRRAILRLRPARERATETVPEHKQSTTSRNTLRHLGSRRVGETNARPKRPRRLRSGIRNGQRLGGAHQRVDLGVPSPRTARIFSSGSTMVRSAPCSKGTTPQTGARRDFKDSHHLCREQGSRLRCGEAIVV